MPVRAFKNEFKNCRIFLVEALAGGFPALRGGICAVRNGGNAPVHWPPVRAFLRERMRAQKEKEFWSRRKRGRLSLTGEKEDRESKERGTKVTRGKKSAREEFGEHYSPSVRETRYILVG